MSNTMLPKGETGSVEWLCYYLKPSQVATVVAMLEENRFEVLETHYDADYAHIRRLIEWLKDATPDYEEYLKEARKRFNG
jgi:hypothetical protein